MMKDSRKRPEGLMGLAAVLAAAGIMVWPGVIFAQSSAAVSASERENLIERRLREMEQRMKSASSPDEAPAVIMPAQQPPVPGAVEPVRDARQKEQSKKVERAQAAREAKLKVRQVKKMLHDARAVHRAGLQQDARDQVAAIGQFLRSEDFPPDQRARYQEQLTKLGRAVDEQIEKQSRRANNQSVPKPQEDVQAQRPAQAVDKEISPVPIEPVNLDTSRQQARESLRQLESAHRESVRAPVMATPTGREVVKKKEALADELRSQREAIIQQQQQARAKLARGIQDLYRRAEEYFHKGELDRALPIFEDLELLSPGYQKTTEYLKKIKDRPSSGPGGIQ